MGRLPAVPRAAIGAGGEVVVGWDSDIFSLDYEF